MRQLVYNKNGIFTHSSEVKIKNKIKIELKLNSSSKEKDTHTEALLIGFEEYLTM